MNRVLISDAILAMNMREILKHKRFRALKVANGANQIISNADEKNAFHPVQYQMEMSTNIQKRRFLY